MKKEGIPKICGRVTAQENGISLIKRRFNLHFLLFSFFTKKTVFLVTQFQDNAQVKIMRKRREKFIFEESFILANEFYCNLNKEMDTVQL